jgi:hypothetical protein
MGSAIDILHKAILRVVTALQLSVVLMLLYQLGPHNIRAIIVLTVKLIYRNIMGLLHNAIL